MQIIGFLVVSSARRTTS